MNDAEHEATKARIEALAAYWLPALGLDRWDIQIVYLRDGLPAAEDACNTGAWAQLATVHSKWEHEDARIEFNMPEVARLDDANLERTVVHECMHIMLNEVRSDEAAKPDWLEHEERTCRELERAFMRVKHGQCVNKYERAST